MAGQKVTRRQKDISRLLREKKYNPRKQPKKISAFLRKDIKKELPPQPKFSMPKRY
jgi:hypothetical protein